MLIRRASVADAETLAALSVRTFTDTYAADNHPADIAAYVSATFGVPQQVAELSDPRLRTMLADMADVPVAYAQLRRGTPPPCISGAAPLELARFYVDRPWHGRGIAGALMTAVLQATRELGGRTLWLGVWERNGRAIAFYRKHGFVDVGSQHFQLGNDLQADRVMVRPVASVLP